jgi:hypothetical protein
MVYGVQLPAKANTQVRLYVFAPTQGNRQSRHGSGLYEETALANYNTLVEKNGRLPAKTKHAKLSGNERASQCAGVEKGSDLENRSYV